MTTNHDDINLLMLNYSLDKHHARQVAEKMAAEYWAEIGRQSLSGSPGPVGFGTRSVLLMEQAVVVMAQMSGDEAAAQIAALALLASDPKLQSIVDRVFRLANQAVDDYEDEIMKAA